MRGYYVKQYSLGRYNRLLIIHLEQVIVLFYLLLKYYINIGLRFLILSIRLFYYVT